VRLALARLVPDATLVLAGINEGGNLGADIHHSGTVAAAREAALHGRKALAASHYHRRGTTIDWSRATAWLEGVLASLHGRELPAGEFWNVNFPDVGVSGPLPTMVECVVDPSPFALDYSLTADGWHYGGNYHERPRIPHGDVATCFAGHVTVSRLRAV
jgi:5'-nucleotidase